MNHDLLHILILAFSILFALGSFLYMDYSMVKKSKEKQEKKAKPPQHS